MVKILMKHKNLLLKMIKEVRITSAERVMVMMMGSLRKEMKHRKTNLSLLLKNLSPRSTSIYLSQRKIMQ